MRASAEGCQTCRTRRIKCDGNKPTCQRCSKSKRICIPSTSSKQATFLIHNENQYASGQAKRPRGPRSQFVVPQQEVDLETKAKAYYLQYHLHIVPSAPGTLGGLSECVSAWRQSGRTDVMVELAISSMALNVYGNTHDDARAVQQASSHYARLLQIVQDRITTVGLPTFKAEDVDACLLTIFLMGRYEGAVHRSGQQSVKSKFGPFQSWSHHEGAMAVLEVWHHKLKQDSASEIVKQTRRGQIRSAILRSRILPEWLLDGSEFGEQGIDLEYDRLFVQLVLLRQSLACAQQKTNVMVTDVKTLDQRANEIYASLQAWMDQVSQTCPPDKHELPISEYVPMPHFYSTKAHSYPDIGHIGIWCQFYAAKMLVLSTWHRILELGRPDLLTYCTNRGQRQCCDANLKQTAQDLAAIVPFCLERFKVVKTDANPESIVLNKDDYFKPYLSGMLIWPLTIASAIDEIDLQQQSWFRAELALVGKAIGDGMLASAGTDEWTLKL